MPLLQKVLRAGEGRKLKAVQSVGHAVAALESEFTDLSDAALTAKTAEFKSRLERGEDLDELMPEAFAAVRAAAQRTLGQRHFDVQIMGGAALHWGWVAEMKTGEGKTLVSTLPAYLNGLTGGGVHMITVNDYLARRDAEWMGQVHRFLGLSVGLIQSQMPPAQRKPAYAADITYGTNNEFGFDYLRDNMAVSPEGMVQRGHVYGIVDEVDSILIDEARTPLIISGRVSDAAKWYKDFARIVPRLDVDEHYEVEEGKHLVTVTEEGVAAVERILGIENLYDHVHTDLVHHMHQALRAKELYKRDRDYLVTDGEVLIVDEFTGRILHGRRYSEGLHQAIEAKEGVAVKDENQTLATITIQNYFRQYDKLAGMTGTASTEAAELKHIYGLDVVSIPTNVDVARLDQGDLIYKDEDAKWRAVVADITQRHEAGQPVLVGTVSVAKSERLAGMLKRNGIAHQVLNAKEHEREGHIVAQAGRLGAVTVATNMAGRGVDIQLGGNPEELARIDLAEDGISALEDPETYNKMYREALDHYREETLAQRQEVLDRGGLYVLGTERHESRRIDNQLRGRSGRQGDPGASRFFISLGDDLMRLFATSVVGGLMDRLHIPEDEPIEHRMVTKAIERAQRQVEDMNFERRKDVLKYDEVLNVQRDVIYKYRQSVLTEGDIDELGREWIHEAVEALVDSFCPDTQEPEDWDIEELCKVLHERTTSTLTPADFGSPDERTQRGIEDKVQDHVAQLYDARTATLSPPIMGQLERRIALTVIDNKWREHLGEMDYLRQGIGLRGMAQRDPLTEYQREGYDMFGEMLAAIKEEFTRYVFHVQVVVRDTRQVQSQESGPGAPAADAPAAPEAAKPGQPAKKGPGAKPAAPGRPAAAAGPGTGAPKPVVGQPGGAGTPRAPGQAAGGANRAQRRAAQKKGKKRR